MATDTRTKDADLDAWLAQVGGAGAYGNGKGTRMGLGENNVSSPNWQQRIALRIPLGSPSTAGSLFYGIPSSDRITQFRVYLRVDNDCGGKGSAIRFFLERGTTTFTENAYAVTCGISSSYASSSEWPGPTRTATNRGSYSGDPAAGAWIYVDLLAMAKAAFDAGLTELVLVGIAANAGLTDYDEETTSRRIRFYTRETTSKPYGQLQWNDNEAPTAPTDLAGSGSSAAGTTATFTFRHGDPEGDAASKYQVQWDQTSDFASPVKDETITTAIANGALKTHSFSGLPARTAGYARARTYDGQWGAWSAAFGLDTSYKPSAVNLAVEPGTLTPELAASISSGDAGDFITAAREIIYQDSAGGGTITKWDSGKQSIGGSPTRTAIEYSGDALAFDQEYRRQMQLWNRDDIASDLTANTYFTPAAPTGGRIKIGASGGPIWSVATKIDDLTPDLYISDPGASNIDQARLRLYNEAGDSIIYDTGLLTFASASSKLATIPGGILTPGMNPQADAAVRITGNANLGPYSDKALGHINATPGTPAPITVSGGTTVQRDDGVWVTTDLTPTVALPFRDTDKDLGYTETPERLEVEINELDHTPYGASPYIDATDPAEEFTTPTLVAEDTYELRARYDDTGAFRSAWSEYIYIKATAAPTLTDIEPADEATVTDPTPTIDATYGHTGAVAELYRRVVIRDGADEVYDSGQVAAGPIEIPVFALPNEAELELEITSTNEDGLTATSTTTFTTAFETPEAIEGLTIAQDDAEMALLISWAPTGRDDFAAYYVDAKSPGGQFRRVTEITDPTATAILYRAAGHNIDTVIRVSQTNGWATSEPAEETGTLVAEGYWLKRP